MKIEIKDPKKPADTLTLDELFVSFQRAIDALYSQTEGKTVKVKGIQIYLTPLDAAGNPVFLPRPKTRGKQPAPSEIKDVISVTPYHGPTAATADQD